MMALCLLRGDNALVIHVSMCQVALERVKRAAGVNGGGVRIQVRTDP